MSKKHNKHAITQADFRIFLTLWNQAQGLATPDIHFRVALWLEHAWKSGEKNLLLMAFRSMGKSTLVGVFCAWLLYCNNDLRILVLAADAALAGKMVRMVKRMIERHPLTEKMRPEKADQWAADRFTVKRMLERRDPSMRAAGVSSNITGSRADLIICDDVEVPNTSDTAGKREALRERLTELSYVQEDQSAVQLYVGTPHSYYTIYAKSARPEIGETKPFLQGFRRLEIPLLDESGTSIWPERFSDAQVAQIREHSGPNKFASQMMLEPLNIMDSRLDPALLQVYEDEIEYVKELGALFIGGEKMLSASAFWDPAYGSVRGDSSVLAVVFADGQGNYYLHRMTYLKTDPRSEIDEAKQQCRAVAQIVKELMLPSVMVESNGIGGFLPKMLRGEISCAGAICGVKAEHVTSNKTARILDAFDAVMAARKLFVHRSVIATPFIREMQEWKPHAEGQRDDGLDAAAGALNQQPVRLPSVRPVRGRAVWGPGAVTHKAATEFEV